MKLLKISVFAILLFGLALNSFSQEEEEKPKDKPVRPMWECGVLIDDQTNYIPIKNTLEFVIEHRFGTIDNGIEDFYGIYAPSNIRLALNYSVRDNLMVGIGGTKDRRLLDGQLKWNVLQQTRQNTVPVAVTLYGNAALNLKKEENIGGDVTFSNRLSYFSQLIVARKISYRFSVQASGSFSHINLVPMGHEHDKLGISFAGRARISPQSSIIATYAIPLEIEGMYEHTDPAIDPEPNLGFGWEISTSTHVFQLFMGTAGTLVPQYDMMYNLNDFTEGELMLGFTITRLWSF